MQNSVISPFPFLEGSIPMFYITPKNESKIGSKSPGNRQPIGYARGLVNHILHTPSKTGSKENYD